MWAPYGLAVSHHQSHFASLVRTISFLIRTSTDESAGGAQKSFDSTRRLCIGRNACCMPRIGWGEMANILFSHKRKRQKSKKRGSSIQKLDGFWLFGSPFSG